jgi:hypothetical protein
MRLFAFQIVTLIEYKVQWQVLGHKEILPYTHTLNTYRHQIIWLDNISHPFLYTDVHNIYNFSVSERKSDQFNFKKVKFSLST